MKRPFDRGAALVSLQSDSLSPVRFASTGSQLSGQENDPHFFCLGGAMVGWRASPLSNPSHTSCPPPRAPCLLRRNCGATYFALTATGQATSVGGLVKDGQMATEGKPPKFYFGDRRCRFNPKFGSGTSGNVPGTSERKET